MFDEKLFIELCKKYDVEMSDEYTKPMLRTKNGIVELTPELFTSIIIPSFKEPIMDYKGEVVG